MNLCIHSCPIFQGFTNLELTPLEAVQVLQRCEHRRSLQGLGPIPKNYLDSKSLGSYLDPSDYKPLQDVSIKFPAT